MTLTGCRSCSFTEQLTGHSPVVLCRCAVATGDIRSTVRPPGALSPRHLLLLHRVWTQTKTKT